MGVTLADRAIFVSYVVGMRIDFTGTLARAAAAVILLGAIAVDAIAKLGHSGPFGRWSSVVNVVVNILIVVLAAGAITVVARRRRAAAADREHVPAGSA